MNTKEYIEHVKGQPPKFGPYSFSRMGTCGYKFKKTYIDREKGLSIGRFDTPIGSAIHDLAEIDIKMRTSTPSDDWKTISEIVDEYVDEHTEYLPFMDELSKMLLDLRMNFNVSVESYIGSEEQMGCTLEGEWCHYDDEKAWFRGKTDYLEINNYAARVVDFKNYPRIHTEEELQNISDGVGCQAMGYLALVMFNYPHVHSGYFEIYYTRFGTSRESNYRDEDGNYHRRYYTRKEVEEWWRLNQRKMVSFERRTTWTPNPSQKECQYCSQIKTCPMAPQGEFIAPDDMTAKDMLQHLIVIREYEKRIKHSLDGFVEKGNIKTTSGVEYGYEEYEQTIIDIKSLLKLARDYDIDLSSYVSISKSAMEKLIKHTKDKGINAELEELVKTKKKTRKISV